MLFNLDFEARVPVPFSIFPSSYRDDDKKESGKTSTRTTTHEELNLHLPHHKPGREGSQVSSSYSAAAADLPPRREHNRYSEEEVFVTREEDHYRRPGVHREEYYREELKEQQPRPPRSHYSEKPPRSSYSDTRIEIDTHRHHHHHHRPESRPAIPISPIDNIERGYRARSQPGYREDVRVTETTVETPLHRPVVKETVHHDEHIIEAPKVRPAVNQTVRVDETVEIDRSPRHRHHHKSKMGYFDEDGHYHSFRHGLHKAADRIIHPQGRETIEVTEVRESRPSRRESQVAYGDEAPNSVTIPCHHIRIGDILILQGRISQVIRISTSSATGQHRYLGVDLFTKQLHEESSSIHNPAPSVVVQTMRGPILKQYRVLDLQDGSVVAMTETGDVKQSLPVLDQSSLWDRLQQAFDSGRGSVRVLVVNDNGREMVVDTKTLHGSSL
ncbi:putative woronin body major protein [Diaporthe ampelina]|uniref:Putative woronin body major protein n=1 Tax=Diaporthe ampelina TaxID=1214573 RepID=A0A0G2HDF9_9PEZI|nr:putative woronin body major protein [Diaporthe ampelina]